MIVKEYFDLEVWKKSYQLSLEIHKATLSFPKYEQYALADQIRRSSKSVCANIAEGFAKQKASKADFKRFLIMAQGSATESHMWCAYCLDLGYISHEISGKWKNEYTSINKMISALHAKI